MVHNVPDDKKEQTRVSPHIAGTRYPNHDMLWTRAYRSLRGVWPLKFTFQYRYESIGLTAVYFFVFLRCNIADWVRGYRTVGYEREFVFAGSTSVVFYKKRTNTGLFDFVTATNHEHDDY